MMLFSLRHYEVEYSKLEVLLRTYLITYIAYV